MNGKTPSSPKKPKVLVLLGSSRGDSNTLKAVQKWTPFPEYDVIDLQSKRIAHYHYEPQQDETVEVDSEKLDSTQLKSKIVKESSNQVGKEAAKKLTEELEDDFYSIAVQLLEYETLIFATPVYWYSMSGQMKVFLDRMTELTGKHKAMGKALKGKKTYLIVCGARPALPEGFEIPFKDTSEYFDMEYVRCFYEQIR